MLTDIRKCMHQLGSSVDCETENAIVCIQCSNKIDFGIHSHMRTRLRKHKQNQIRINPESQRSVSSVKWAKPIFRSNWWHSLMVMCVCVCICHTCWLEYGIPWLRIRFCRCLFQAKTWHMFSFQLYKQMNAHTQTHICSNQRPMFSFDAIFP